MSEETLFPLGDYSSTPGVGDYSQDVDISCPHFWLISYDTEGLPLHKCGECGEKREFVYPRDKAKIATILTNMITREDRYRQASANASDKLHEKRYLDAYNSIRQQREKIISWWDNLKGSGSATPVQPVSRDGSASSHVDLAIRKAPSENCIDGSMVGETNPSIQNEEGEAIATPPLPTPQKDDSSNSPSGYQVISYPGSPAEGMKDIKTRWIDINIGGGINPSTQIEDSQNCIDGFTTPSTNPSTQNRQEKTPINSEMGETEVGEHYLPDCGREKRSRTRKRKHGLGTGSIYCQTRRGKKGTYKIYYLKVQDWRNGNLVKQYSKYIPRDKLEDVKIFNSRKYSVQFILDFIDS